MPEIPVKIMMNVGNPERAFSFARLPHAGIGLARLEFIISNMIGIHPRALLEFDRMEPDLQQAIQERISGYEGPIEYFVERLSEGISTLAAAFAPEKLSCVCPILNPTNMLIDLVAMYSNRMKKTRT
eukprot:UN00390